MPSQAQPPALPRAPHDLPAADPTSLAVSAAPPVAPRNPRPGRATLYVMPAMPRTGHAAEPNLWVMPAMPRTGHAAEPNLWIVPAMPRHPRCLVPADLLSANRIAPRAYSRVPGQCQSATPSMGAARPPNPASDHRDFGAPAPGKSLLSHKALWHGPTPRTPRRARGFARRGSATHFPS